VSINDGFDMDTPSHADGRRRPSEATKRALAEAFKHEQAAAKRAGELKNFLQKNGFSADTAEHITEALEMYECSDLQYLSMEDIREAVADLSPLERLTAKYKLMNFADTARRLDAAAHAARPVQSTTADSSCANQYLIGAL